MTDPEPDGLTHHTRFFQALKNLWETEINRAACHLAYPGVRQWWDAGGKTQLTPQFVKLIESVETSATTWDWESGRGFVEHDAENQPSKP